MDGLTTTCRGRRNLPLARAVVMVGIVLALWFNGMPNNVMATTATPTPVPVPGNYITIKKEVCRPLSDAVSRVVLKRELELEAKRAAANELFGELIVATTSVRNSVVTEDQLRSQSLGLVRVEGSPTFYTRTTEDELCIELTAYATEQDYARFEPQTVVKRSCISGSDRTLLQVRSMAEESARLQALYDYDVRLQRYTPADILPLLRQLTYLESNIAADTDNYCVSVRGVLFPVEVEGFLALRGGRLLPVAVTPSPAMIVTATPDRTATAVAEAATIEAGVHATLTAIATATRRAAALSTARPSPVATVTYTRKVQTSPIDSQRTASIWNRTTFRDLGAPGTNTYPVDVQSEERLRWAFEWCAVGDAHLQSILNPFELDLRIDGVSVPLSDLTIGAKTVGKWKCRYWATIVSDWPSDTVVTLEILYVLSSTIFDGEDYFPSGQYRQVIYATVE